MVVSINNQLQVFRIVQELINTSVKHGNSKNIDIDFDEINATNTCIYNDNGIGFDLKNLDNAK